MKRVFQIRTAVLVNLVLVLTLILAACNGGAIQAPPPQEASEDVAESESTESTDETADTAAESSSSASAAGIVDEIVVVEEPIPDVAITRLSTSDIDIFASATSDPEVFASVQEAGLSYAQSFGNYSELTFNPAGPVFEGTGKLNPFSVARVREAMNWLIDRDFIAQELYGGLAQPRYTAITPAFPDYARLVDVARQLELTYAHNPDKANEVFTEEMEALGAEMVDGKWNYEGEPVEIIVLIRTEDVRNDVGDYVSNLLEDIGFTVTRDYKAAADASPIWIRGNPPDGEFHIYTGGWITTAVSRDQAGNFDFFYTPRGLSFPLWQAYTPSEAFDTVSDRLARRDFSTLEERKELFAEALTLSLQDSTRVWVVSQLGATPYGSDISIAADLAGGVSGTMLWAHTLRKGDEAGSTATIAMPSILTEPWNPVAGSNWIFDSMLQRGMTSSGTMPDPFTGLSWPQRLERAEVTIQEGLPVGKTLDWVDLEFAAEISVPEDAIIDWDAVEQRWITVGEKHPEGLTALRKSVVYYPSDLWNVQWHDGSTVSIADLMLGQIIGYDRAKPESAIFDESAVPSFEQFQESFRGWRIVSEDPLVVENYTDVFGLDAEANVTTFFPGTPWTTLSVGIMADAAGELAFSSDKAETLEIEWANYIAGPSLEILEAKMNESAEAGSIPYAEAMADYITDDEIAERWASLQAWYAEQGHFWVDQGQYYLEEAFPVEGTVILKRFGDYPDDADKWTRFSTPQIADVLVEGDSRVTVGEETIFDVDVSFNGEPYAIDDIDTVKYLIFDAVGELAISGEAESIEDGLFQVVLTAEQTAELETGANRVEIAVVPKLVSVPTFGSVEFVTVP
ncbi:MAG: ABC transporter substrate-binding protein [Chloroflexota bacterium]